MTVTSSSPPQLRSKLWHTINERYPGAMIEKTDFIPLTPVRKPIDQCKLAFVSTAGVQLKGTLPFDTVHPIGDYTFRRVPTTARADQLEIHQIKYPTVGAHDDINVIFPIDRLRDLVADGVLGGLTTYFYSFIGYNMDPERVEYSLAEDIARAVVAEQADIALLCPA